MGDFGRCVNHFIFRPVLVQREHELGLDSILYDADLGREPKVVIKPKQGLAAFHLMLHPGSSGRPGRLYLRACGPDVE